MTLFNDDEQQQISDAIAKAEKNTSGEIRICVEKHCKDDVLDRAAKYFYQLGMEKTKLRNGVLIYMAVVDHKFAIIGDAGINKVVPADFWDCTKDAMLEQFKHGNLIEGIIEGIARAGEKLGAFFPCRPDDVNEISNEVSFMDGD